MSMKITSEDDFPGAVIPVMFFQPPSLIMYFIQKCFLENKQTNKLTNKLTDEQI